MTVATVREWTTEEGRGVLEAPDAPGDSFVHFSFIEMEGFKMLRSGQRVELDLEGPLPFEQDACRWYGHRVRPLTAGSFCDGGRQPRGGGSCGCMRSDLQ
jgi:cold shock protein